VAIEWRWLVHWPLMGGLLRMYRDRRGLGGLRPCPVPSSLYQSEFVWPVQLWVSDNYTFEAISGHLTQSSPIHAIPPTNRSNPIQSNPIHGWIQSVSNSGLPATTNCRRFSLFCLILYGDHAMSLTWSNPIQCKYRVRLWRWRSVYAHYVLGRFSVCHWSSIVPHKRMTASP